MIWTIHPCFLDNIEINKTWKHCLDIQNKNGFSDIFTKCVSPKLALSNYLTELWEEANIRKLKLDNIFIKNFHECNPNIICVKAQRIIEEYNVLQQVLCFRDKEQWLKNFRNFSKNGAKLNSTFIKI